MQAWHTRSFQFGLCNRCFCPKAQSTLFYDQAPEVYIDCSDSENYCTQLVNLAFYRGSIHITACIGKKWTTPYCTAKFWTNFVDISPTPFFASNASHYTGPRSLSKFTCIKVASKESNGTHCLLAFESVNDGAGAELEPFSEIVTFKRSETSSSLQSKEIERSVY